MIKTLDNARIAHCIERPVNVSLAKGRFSQVLEGWRVIRRAVQSDMDTIVAIWLEASIQSHGFVAEAFWREQVPAMRDHYVPSAESYVFVADSGILGFISLMEETLAALFVSPAAQGNGVGISLLGHAQSLRRSLVTTVYAENERALEFYSRHGFVCTERRVDDATGAPEVALRWQTTF